MAANAALCASTTEITGKVQLTISRSLNTARQLCTAMISSSAAQARTGPIHAYARTCQHDTAKSLEDLGDRQAEND